ncbi:MAG: SOS response-associated peptidase [Propionibacteriales bacterium]|nr:SOS response-associated peptidase [Propionibacteriales bacterium]
MCGRYASSRSPDDLIEEFEIEQVDVREKLEPDYNVAPTDEVYAVLSRPPREDKSAPPVRRLRVLRWGLVPWWARDPKIGSRLINARMETVDTKSAFRKAFASRRCLLPADGYYEWYETSQRAAKGKPVKQPFFIRPRDGSVMAMAGLYEIWRDPSHERDHPEAFRWTCTVLTTTAEDSVGRIHDRMPLLVEPDRHAAWLDPRASGPEELRSLLVPAAPGRLEAFPVSRAVNDVRNNGAELVAPVEPEDELVLPLAAEPPA